MTNQRRSPNDEIATIVIPQRDQAELTIACLASTRRHETVLWPIMVVDDGSAEGAIERIADTRDPATQVLRQPPHGVTAAWNRGLAAAATPYVIFLNNDVLCDGPWGERLIAPLQSGSFLLAGAEWRRERCLPANLLQRLPLRDFVAGWCIAASRATLNQLGGFDETMRLYWSDTDLQCRLRRHAAGPSPLAVVPHLPLKHLGHRSVGRLTDRREQWGRDRQVFIEKWSD